MLPMQYLLSEKLSEIDYQYKKIFLVNWKEEMIFNDEIPKEAVAIWFGVLEYENQMKEHPFQEIATYALAYLTTPTSNAVFERVFLHMAKVKT